MVYIDLDFVHSKLGMCSQISFVSFISIRSMSDIQNFNKRINKSERGGEKKKRIIKDFIR